jgi:hypothetical protein
MSSSMLRPAGVDLKSGIVSRKKLADAFPVRANACVYVYMYVHTYVYVYIHTCIHTYIHTYTHTYIHTYIHTHKCMHIRRNGCTVRGQRRAVWRCLEAH